MCVSISYGFHSVLMEQGVPSYLLLSEHKDKAQEAAEITFSTLHDNKMMEN